MPRSNKIKKYKKKNITLKIKKISDKCEYKILPLFEKEFGKNNKHIVNDNDYQKFLIKAFATPYSPHTIQPYNDFYSYINYSWLYLVIKKNKEDQIKTYYVQQDSYRIIQNKVYFQLIDIVNKYIHSHKNDISNQLNNVYKSLLHLNEKSAENHINNVVMDIKNYIRQDNLLSLLANINKNQLVLTGCPIVWTIDPDQKNNSINSNYINYPQLSIFDYTVYVESKTDSMMTKKYKKKIKHQYFKYLNAIFNTCVGSQYGYTAQDVWDVEYDLLSAMGCNEIKESPDYYDKIYTKDSFSKYGFDWIEFSKLVGYKTTPSFFITSNINYLKCVMKLLKENWKSKKWEAYFVYIFVRQIIRFHKKWRDDIFFNFVGKIITGQEVPMPDTIYPIFGLSYCFDTFLTNEYVNKYQNTKYIQYVENLCKELLIVFKRIVTRNTWLSPSTKKYALLKLENLKFIIGSPKILRPDPLLDYDINDAWGNMVKMSLWKINKQVSLHGKALSDLPLIDWSEMKLTGNQAYIVNAFYTPVKNSIYIPLAYLQEPFIDLDERGMEYNLAHIGYTIAHEMSHCLDDTGSKYDYKGNLYNWWTPRDRKIFERKVRNVIKQYEVFASYDGIIMDASYGVGEDLADISGLAICTEYLRDFQVKNGDVFSIRALSFEEFFQYIAIANRQVIYKNAILAQLKMNPHPLNKYRTNCPLARLELFDSLYNVKKGDKMYWSSKDTIW